MVPSGQIDKPRPCHAGQSLGQIVGLHLIVTFGGLNDPVVNLDEFFGVARAVILVDRSRLELVRLGNLPELGCQSTERSPP
jgi:hypothetical protein